MRKNLSIIAGAVLLLIGLLTGQKVFPDRALLGAVVATTDTVNTFRLNFNSLDEYVRSTTSTLGSFTNLATTTGNIPVASTSVGWTVLTAGTNGNILMASSTAASGVSWEGSPNSVSNRLILTGSRISLVSSTANGDLLIGSGTGGLWNIAGLTGTSNQITVTNGSGTITLAISAAYAPSSTIPVLPISIANGGTNTSSAPTTNNLLFYNGTSITSTSTLTTYNSLSGTIVLSGPSSTIDSSFYQKTFPVPIIIREVDCWDSTAAVTSTISIDRRTSSTPNTRGPEMLVSMACGLTRNATTTANLAIATATRDFTVNFSVTSSAGYVSTSTLTVQLFYEK